MALDAVALWRAASVPPLLSSFSEEALAAARDAVPELKRALLVERIPVVAEEDPDILTALLETLQHREAGGRWTHLVLGLHEADPLLRVAQRYRTASYVTHLFLVCWPDGEKRRRRSALAAGVAAY